MAQAAQGGAVQSPSLEVLQKRVDAAMRDAVGGHGLTVGQGDLKRSLPTSVIR